MRRGLVHVLAWLLATAAATTLSWWGVHTVMAGTAYDPPRAVPITAAEAAAHASAQPPAPPAPTPTPTPTPRRTSAPPSPTPTRTAPTPTATPTPPAPTTPSGDVKAYDTGGGRAVFDLGPASATLVSATPGTGWSMQVFKTETWIRVEFSRSTDRVTVFCDWHDGPPHVDVQTY
ncbi:hypothetical protein [Streptomyces sp. NBC_00566]|uniref:hypothetical protein n=1 Tax=Streptomyces sp. NBC_00566 TaxID=2975778 RepID=UPI002E808E40|nr:hypothetical protein [Streptomyces sp. NBC_00566]WUB88603.1 hypothetical protein OG812_19320 [Streptomyces sp. NBC_00566]